MPCRTFHERRTGNGLPPKWPLDPRPRLIGIGCVSLRQLSIHSGGPAYPAVRINHGRPEIQRMRPESKRVLNPSLSYRLFMLGLFLVLPKAVDAWLESRAPPTISARGAAQTARFQFGKAFLGG